MPLGVRGWTGPVDIRELRSGFGRAGGADRCDGDLIGREEREETGVLWLATVRPGCGPAAQGCNGGHRLEPRLCIEAGGVAEDIGLDRVEALEAWLTRSRATAVSVVPKWRMTQARPGASVPFWSAAARPSAQVMSMRTNRRRMR